MVNTPVWNRERQVSAIAGMRDHHDTCRVHVPSVVDLTKNSLMLEVPSVIAIVSFFDVPGLAVRIIGSPAFNQVETICVPPEGVLYVTRIST